MPLNAPLPSILRSSFVKQMTTPSLEPERTGSTTREPPYKTPRNASQHVTLKPETQTTIVARGLLPSQILVSRITSPASKDLGVIPNPTDVGAPKVTFFQKQQAKFALGGFAGSDKESLKNRDLNSTSNEQKKTASFNSQVVTQSYTSSAISDTEDDYNESAIEDEDWEEESAEEDLNFQRIDYSTNLPSRRSLITLMFSEYTPAVPRSSGFPNGPSPVASPKDPLGE